MFKKMRVIIASLLIIPLLSYAAFAASFSEMMHSEWADPVLYIKLVALFVVFLTILVLLLEGKFKENHKTLLFYLFVIPVMASTLYLGAHTVYENIQSETGGPIHWHADYQVWACGERLDLIDPTGLKNKIGSPLFHEHNDDRIHVEGTVMHLEDIDLGSYFEVIGGELNEQVLVYPTEGKGIVEYSSGETCPNGEVGEVQVFVNGKKQQDFANYLMYPHALVPPGDCIIVEFGPGKETTDKICESWDTKKWTYDNYEELRSE